MSAKEIQRDGEILHLRGNVSIAFDGNVLTADQADVNTSTGEITPSGNVQVRRRGLTAEQQAVWLLTRSIGLAQVNHDLDALDRILHPAFYAMNSPRDLTSTQ